METTREDRQRHCIRVGVGRAFRPDKKNLGEIRVPRWISFCGSKSLVFVRRCHRSLSTAAICWCTTCKQIWNSTQSLQNSRFWWQPDSSASLPPFWFMRAEGIGTSEMDEGEGAGAGGGSIFLPPPSPPFPNSPQSHTLGRSIVLIPGFLGSPIQDGGQDFSACSLIRLLCRLQYSRCRISCVLMGIYWAAVEEPNADGTKLLTLGRRAQYCMAVFRVALASPSDRLLGSQTSYRLFANTSQSSFEILGF